MSIHLTSPKSVGLFQQIILESGAFYPTVAIPMSCGEDNYAHILQSVGCNDLACMLAKPAIDLKRASEKYLLFSCLYAPIVDGVEMDTHPWIALKEGKAADKT